MKILFTLFLICLLNYSMGQDNSIKIGRANFKTIPLSNNLTIYRSLCENRYDYNVASQSLIQYDSTAHIGYLSPYYYVGKFNCRESIDDSIREQLKEVLLAKKKYHNRTGFLFSMEDKNKEFIAILFLFKKGKFKKFTKNADKISTKNYAGEKISIREFNYSKYAEEFILAKTANKLSLISVSSLL